MKMPSALIPRQPRQLLSICVRWSSALSGVQTRKVDENLELRLLNPDGRQALTRPLVLLFSWLLAKKRHLDKYSNLYLSEGCDVLNIQVRPSQVLYPPKAQKVASSILDLLVSDTARQKPLFVHGFSVGGYMYGELLVKLQREAEKYAQVRKRFIGQIFDSPVDFEGVPRGFANILSTNAVIKAGIKSTIELYLNLFKNSITLHYLASSQAFHDNSLRLPSLLLYSRADPIGVAEIIEMVAQKWRDLDIDVKMKCWENSPHVSHFHHHPDEYVEAILSFLEHTGFQKLDTLAENEALHNVKAMKSKP